MSLSKVTEEVRTVNTDGDRKEKSIKDMEILLIDGNEATNIEKWRLYMYLYIHGVRKKSTTYLFHSGMDLMNTKNLLTPHHYKKTSEMCFWG